MRHGTRYKPTRPLSLLYTSLIGRVHDTPDGFDRLSQPEKVFYSVGLLRNEINNGGFRQYFFNSSGSYYEQAKKGLVVLGATQTLELLRKAKAVLFATMSVPTETRKRRELLPVAASGALTPEWVNQLDELDKLFYKDADRLTPRLETFAREQGLVRAESPSDS